MGVPVFHVFLVRPSKYDDEGFVIRHWRAVVPSNSLACLYGLTEDVRQRRLLGDVDLRIHVVDEAVTKFPLDKICRLSRRTGERVLVCLVGVQTNQFCRAADIALTLRREGVAVMIGGFHVSGMLAMFPALSPEIQQLVDAGVSVVAGEVEHRWADLLLASLSSATCKPVYRFLDDPPDLSDAPLSHHRTSSSRRKFVHSNYGTIDCSRGCPFNCSFCTIINVQGRKSRYRSPECIADTIRHAFRESGVNLYFFTDDNFARNPAWEEIFDRIIALREHEGIAIEFVIQVDIGSYKIPGFIEKAARAGCCSVFIGMESLNPRNLQAAGKTQNRVQEYRVSIASWHNARITTLVGYIIGFPYDTEESVRDDIERLIREVQPDQAAFFMMTPLPGSRDHQRMLEAGAPMESDYNCFDSFHESMAHPHMKDGAWTRAYAGRVAEVLQLREHEGHSLPHACRKLLGSLLQLLLVQELHHERGHASHAGRLRSPEGPCEPAGRASGGRADSRTSAAGSPIGTGSCAAHSASRWKWRSCGSLPASAARPRFA